MARGVLLFLSLFVANSVGERTWKPAQVPGRTILVGGAETRGLSSCRDLHRAPVSLEDAANTQKHQWYIHFKGPARQGLKEDIATVVPGATVTYVPHDTFLVSATVLSARACLQIPDVIWVGPVLPVAKLSQDLASRVCAGEWTKPASLRNVPGVSLVGPLDLYVVLAGPDARPKSETKWRVALNKAGFGAHSVKSVSARKLVVSATEESVARLTRWLAAQRDVVFVERKPQYHTMNKFARWMVQTGRQDDTLLWDKGLRGEGQVVGVGDTGLDTRLCFFNDPSVPIPFNNVSTTHRKIVTYRFYQEGGDEIDSDGHGSHVCGSVAGAALSSDPAVQRNLSKYDGMAPAAKLAFTDIAGPDGDLVIPDDLSEEYFGHPYEAGARIHSNSWGSSMPSYTSNAREVDTFMYQHPDMLVLFAAGNDGEYGFHSVGSPATAKNLIAVGASQSAVASFVQRNIIPIQLTYHKPDKNLTFDVIAADFGPGPKDGVVNGTVIMGDPSDGCSSFLNCHLLKRKVVFLMRGTCLFIEKVVQAQHCGAAAVVILNNGRPMPSRMGSSPTVNASSIVIPSVLVSQERGQEILEDYAAWNDEFYVTLPIELDVASKYGADNLAPFSSRGPTQDNRIKPDIVAPGQYIFSAKSQTAAEVTDGSGLCSDFGQVNSSVTAMAGTSMATPVSAGAAALVRQYFLEGWYPSGAKAAADGFEPSAALVKAMMMSGTVPLTGFVEDGPDLDKLPLSPKLPNNFQGWGSLRLSESLKFAGLVGSHSLFVLDAARTVLVNGTVRVSSEGGLVGTGEYVSWNFVAGSTHQFRAMLVWTDPPGHPSALAALVNDLDLIVQYDGPEGLQIVYGNQLVAHGGGLDIENPQSEWRMRDATNNVEDVRLTLGPGTNVKVSVRGTNVPEGPQPFALVVTGAFAEPTRDNSPLLCPDNCHGHGQCINGQCKCHRTRVGVACERKIAAIGPEGVASSLLDQTFQYFYFDFNTTGAGWSLTMTALLGDPDVFVRYEALPTLSVYDDAERQCDNCLIFRPDGPSVITNTSSPIGRFYVGVTAFCCEPAAWTLNLTVVDCDGAPWDNADSDIPRSMPDVCGVCGGDDTSCEGCDGVPNSGVEEDECGVCGGDGSSCSGCDGVPYSGAEYDQCGVCDGDGTCVCERDEKGEPDCASEPIVLSLAVSKHNLDLDQLLSQLSTALNLTSAKQLVVSSVCFDFQAQQRHSHPPANGSTVSPLPADSIGAVYFRVRGPPSDPFAYRPPFRLLDKLYSDGSLSNSLGMTVTSLTLGGRQVDPNTPGTSPPSVVIGDNDGPTPNNRTHLVVGLGAVAALLGVGFVVMALLLYRSRRYLFRARACTVVELFDRP